jgi:hypothetical protein
VDPPRNCLDFRHAIGEGVEGLGLILYFRDPPDTGVRASHCGIDTHTPIVARRDVVPQQPDQLPLEMVRVGNDDEAHEEVEWCREAFDGKGR